MVATMIMQRMSVAMEYGVILKWLKKEGDPVKKGEPVVEIFGEKNEFELEAPEDGILLKILCDVNDEIPISEPIAYIGKKGDTIPDARPKKMNVPVPQAAVSVSTPKSVTSAPTPSSSALLPDGRVRASPRARMRAKAAGIDLTKVTGTGPEGRVVERDVLSFQPPAAAPSETTPPADDRRIRTVEPMSPLRRTIARRMTQSAQNPHITMITEIDMTEVVTLREMINASPERQNGVRVSFNDIIVKAVADVLERFPRFNATLVGNELHCYEDINIGVAMATPEGLIVVNVRRANKKSITQIAQETKMMAKKAREGTLSADEMTGTTFTVSNLGPFEVDLFIPVINPPEAAILALGQIKKKPVVVDDKIVIRSMMMASCAVDHRILDGAPAGQFLAALKSTLERPFFMSI
ncbi:MAG: 2-oxo acid dehydrogenase subunit E2 [Candidatus Thorarchaeota archaeon]|nr:2-oxo acid dehydrogenase subunit E2 [Candidatus Thorarchaeota archaeon]